MNIPSSVKDWTQQEINRVSNIIVKLKQEKDDIEKELISQRERVDELKSFLSPPKRDCEIFRVPTPDIRKKPTPEAKPFRALVCSTCDKMRGTLTLEEAEQEGWTNIILPDDHKMNATGECNRCPPIDYTQSSSPPEEQPTEEKKNPYDIDPDYYRPIKCRKCERRSNIGGALEEEWKNIVKADDPAHEESFGDCPCQ